MYRTTKRELEYKKYRQSEKSCYFCNPEPKVVIKKSKNFYIIKNNFPYGFWDGQKVLDHLLIVSNNHFADLENREDTLLEYVRQLNKYNSLGYDVFTRVPNSPSRSQPHFHTHLIKTAGKKIKSLKFNFEPYSLEVE